MQLSIFSLQRVLFQEEAESLNCNTSSGEVTILDHHRPLISKLVAGTIKITTADKEEFLQIKGGFLRVATESKVSLIVEE